MELDFSFMKKLLNQMGGNKNAKSANKTNQIKDGNEKNLLAFDRVLKGEFRKAGFLETKPKLFSVKTDTSGSPLKGDKSLKNQLSTKLSQNENERAISLKKSDLNHKEPLDNGVGIPSASYINVEQRFQDIKTLNDKKGLSSELNSGRVIAFSRKDSAFSRKASIIHLDSEKSLHGSNKAESPIIQNKKPLDLSKENLISLKSSLEKKIAEGKKQVKKTINQNDIKETEIKASALKESDRSTESNILILNQEKPQLITPDKKLEEWSSFFGSEANQVTDKAKGSKSSLAGKGDSQNSFSNQGKETSSPEISSEFNLSAIENGEIATDRKLIKEQIQTRLEQLRGKMSVIGKEQVTMNLNPERLGKIKIEMNNRDENSSVLIEFENSEALNLAKEDFADLKTQLSEMMGKDVDLNMGQFSDRSQSGGSEQDLPELMAQDLLNKNTEHGNEEKHSTARNDDSFLNVSI